MKINESNYSSLIQYVLNLPAFTGSIILFTTFFVTLYPDRIQNQEFESYTESIPESNADIELVPVEGGTFTMENPSSDNPVTMDIEVSSFWMGKYEITWNQFEEFMFSEEFESVNERFDSELADAVTLPSRTYIDPGLGMERGENPAVNMTQYSALAFTRWLTLKTGNFYRLPTEAEWEYACLAGSASAYHFGEEESLLYEYAWFVENSNNQYHPVGSKKPNKFNLYDMHGNAAEWTMDQYKEDYASAIGNDTTDPRIPPTTFEERTVKGGSWNHDSDELECSARIASNPDRWKQGDPQIPKSLWWNTHSPFVGFRIVRPLEPPSQEEIKEYWETNLDEFFYE